MFYSRSQNILSLQLRGYLSHMYSNYTIFHIIRIYAEMAITDITGHDVARKAEGRWKIHVNYLS